AIPAGLGRCQPVSLKIKYEAGNTRHGSMNTAPAYYSRFFGVALCRTGSRFDTVEVWGSSPHVPTIYLIESAGDPQAVTLRVVSSRQHSSTKPRKVFRRLHAAATGSEQCRFPAWLRVSSDLVVPEHL